MSSDVEALRHMSDEEVEQLMYELKSLRSDNEIMKRLLATIETMRQLLTNRMNKCLCNQSNDTKLKTKLNVLNHKYDELKSELDLDSMNTLTNDMIVVKSEQQTDDSLTEPEMDQLDNEDNDNDMNETSDWMTCHKEISEPSVDPKNSSKGNEKPNIIYINIENIETINKSVDIDHQYNESDEEVDRDGMDDTDADNSDAVCCDFADSKSGILCHKVCKTAETLMAHKSRHSGPKPWFCEYKSCQYRAVLRSHLIGHVRKSHTGRYQFSCDWPGCSFMGPSRYNVKRHKIIHTGEKPYKCNWPGCEWSSANNKIADHKRIHTGERPYACNWVGCEARFSRPFTLRNHERTHTKEKPFVCDYPNCDFKSSQQTPLTAHKRKHHNSSANIASEESISLVTNYETVETLGLTS